MDPHRNQYQLYGWLITIFYVKYLSVVNSRFPNQIKAQRSGFDLEATNHDFTGMLRSRNMETEIMHEEPLVTHTGFEPMLTA